MMSIIVYKLWFVNISALFFPVASLFLTQNNLNLNHELNYLDNLNLFQTSFPEFNNHHIWYLSIETPSRQNSLRISWKYFLMAFFFAVLFQMLSLHPSSVISAELLYLICSVLFSKSSSLCLFWQFQLKSCDGVYFCQSCWLTASKFTEMKPHDEYFPWNYWDHILTCLPE